MISQLIPLKKENRTGVAIAVVLFVLQMAYYQMQGVIGDTLTGFLPQQGEAGIPALGINSMKSLVYLIHIGVHAAFSIVIVWFLYKDKSGTMLVFYISLALVAVYVITNLIGKLVDFFTINIISTEILAFISSPFKTIFSVPMLKIKHPDETVPEKDLDKSNRNDHSVVEKMPEHTR